MDSPARVNDVEFLRGQLAVALAHLATKDATETEVAKRFEGLYSERFDLQKQEMERFKKSWTEELEKCRQYALRYALLRTFLVRVKLLDLLSTGEHLDYLLDKELERRKQGPTD